MPILYTQIIPFLYSTNTSPLIYSSFFICNNLSSLYRVIALETAFSASSMRITGNEKASTSFQSCSVSGATENTLANGGMYRMAKWARNEARMAATR